jgi:hypothetical protein
MAPFLPRLRVVFAAMAIALPFSTGGGCGSRAACFQFSQAQFAAQNGCPAQADALPNFTDPHCPAGIVSVDSAGSFDGELCCYEVTYDDIVPDCGSGGMGGTTGIGSGPPPFSGGMVAVSTATSSSSSGGPFPCTSSCSQAVGTGEVPCPGLTASELSALQDCAQCNTFPPGSTDCTGECPQLCASGGPFDSNCQACLMMNCAGPLFTCLNN